MSDHGAVFCGWTQREGGPRSVCGCETVVLTYQIDEGGVVEAINWCPCCEATWIGLEYHREYREWP